ncbi:MULTISPECIES: rhodanese-related sulfurtransferase [unclassified Brevundimonas]|uniref:oxygen-dependent tRNA uridine(34) hydroxylase TrhO n=1 Tax=unclassified Brevundimonas TaxID=2622653 RepID=UPI0020030CB5|nr:MULTISPECIES: rhodanese-related sulfurtransferase [unclassified Brevundimonas]MCK6103097.1 rhodanese-related sulfurtransferase [Brevundimonas sp. EYE_349]
MTDIPTSPEQAIRVAALYRFAPVADPARVRERLQAVCDAGQVRGTLLVAHEGLNGTIAGPINGVEAVLDAIHALPGFDRLELKYAWTDISPFHRMKVRVKTEIVTMGQPDLDPARDAGVYVSPADWNALIADPETLVIDTRNAYESEIGAFEGAVKPNTESFRDFPDWFRTEGRALLAQTGARRVAMYCTGGIRCEKSTAFLKAEGIKNVHHLEGGILRYLETTSEQDSLWHGECFVFDERVSVGHGLIQGAHTLCRGCRLPVDEVGRASVHYVEGVCCARCHDTRDEGQRARYAERHRQIEIAQKRGQTHIGASPNPNGVADAGRRR